MDPMRPGRTYSGAVTTEALDSTRSSSRLRSLVDRATLGALVLAGAIPFLFVHERYQPDLGVGVGATTVDVRLSDVAVLVVVIAAARRRASRDGLARLRAGRSLWLAGAALLAWLAFADLPTRLPRRRPLRRPSRELPEARRVRASRTGRAAARATRHGPHDRARRARAVGRRRGRRRAPAVLRRRHLRSVERRLAPAVLPRPPRPRRARRRRPRPRRRRDRGGQTRAPGERPLRRRARRGRPRPVLAGSVAAAGGLALGAVVLWIAARRRFAHERPPDARARRRRRGGGRRSGSGARRRARGLPSLRRRPRRRPAAVGVETYSQRTVLAYIGLRIFEDNPVLGVGWQRSSRPEVFEPYVDDARARFPDVVDLAFPAEGREWGVQNLYIQMLADAGVIGLALLLARRRRGPRRWPGARRHAHRHRGPRARVCSSSARCSRSRRSGPRSASSPGSRCRRRRACCSGSRPRERRPSRKRQCLTHGSILRGPCRPTRSARRSSAGSASRPTSPHRATRPVPRARRGLRRASRTSRSSPRTPRPTSASTPSTTRGRSCRARSRRFRSTTRRFDVVLCNQVLEHCDDPVQAVSRASPGDRAGRPRARHDARRHAVPPVTDRLLALDARGPREALRGERAWASVRVTPASGTTACLGMLFAMYLDLGFRRYRPERRRRARSSP